MENGGSFELLKLASPLLQEEERPFTRPFFLAVLATYVDQPRSNSEIHFAWPVSYQSLLNL